MSLGGRHYMGSGHGLPWLGMRDVTAQVFVAALPSVVHPGGRERPQPPASFPIVQGHLTWVSF